MICFSDLYQTAVLHKGGEKNVNAGLPEVKDSEQLCLQTDAFYLSTLCLRVFRAGLKHSLVDAKWPAFELAFRQFDPHHCAMLSDDEIDLLMANTAIIRHLGKIKSVRDNAQMLRTESMANKGFGCWLAAWPTEDVVGLWLYLKKHGRQLGGMSAAYFLRMTGKDTFLLTRDVVAVLIAHGVVSKAPSSQADYKAVQNVFLAWQQQCGRPLAEISRIVSYTAGI